MFRTLFNVLKDRSSRKPVGRTPRPASVCRPRVEALEDRCLLSLVLAGNYYTRGNYLTDIGIDDVNADAHLDLVVDSYTIIPYDPHNEAPPEVIEYRDVFFGDGAGGFPNWNYSGPAPVGGQAPDFNRDGITDAFGLDLGVWDSWQRVYVGSSVSVQLADGAGGFGAPQTVWSGATLGAVTAGDFNQDGYSDLAVTNSSNWYGSVSVLLNDGAWPPLPPPISAVRIGDVAVTEGHTGTRAAAFTVSLSIASGQPVTVDYATANGTATGGTDYQSAFGTLTFAPGEISKTVTILVNGDRVGEPNESFVVTLGNPTNSYIADAQAVGTIADDEPRISINDVAKAEGRKGRTTLFIFTVTLSAAYDQPVTMSFATADGSARAYSGDYVPKSGTLTFAPGETMKTITVQVKGDGKREYDEYFFVDLAGNSGNSLFTKSYGVGEILNDD